MEHTHWKSTSETSRKNVISNILSETDKHNSKIRESAEKSKFHVMDCARKDVVRLSKNAVSQSVPPMSEYTLRYRLERFWMAFRTWIDKRKGIYSPKQRYNPKTRIWEYV